MSYCSINIPEMKSLQSAMVSAESVTRGDKSTLSSTMSGVLLDTSPLNPVPAVTSWITDMLVDVRRRLAMAQAIAASTPGVGSFVQFDESTLSKLTPAQAKQRAKQVKAAMQEGDLTKVLSLLDGEIYDPYFAAAFARGTSTRDLEQFIMGQQGYGQLRGGVSSKDYETVLTALGQTLGLASRGTGDLDLGSSWRNNFVQEMTAPTFRGDPNETSSYTDFDQRTNDRTALWLLLERGQWSTNFLKLATQRVIGLDRGGHSALVSPKPGYEWALEPNGEYAADPMKSLLLGLAHNPEAARWAFTQGDSSSMPVCGNDVPVNGFLHRVLLDHQYRSDADQSVAMLALQAAIGGDKTSPIALDVRTISDSLAEQKAKWDAMPWYKKWGHTILDVIGMIPVIGDIANVPNAAWYALEGDWADAGVTAAGMIPMVGDAALGGKVAVDLGKGAKLLKTVRMMDVAGKDGKELENSLKLLQKADEVEPAVFKFDNVEDFQRAANAPHPNVTYEFDGIRYTTDGEGRPIKVTGTPLKKKGVSDPEMRRAIGNGPDAEDTDVGFHLFAESFGGPTNKLNVVPGNGKVTEENFAEFKNLNTSDYARMETQVRTALKDPKVKDLNLTIEPVYVKPGTRPSQFRAVVRVDGREFKYKFKNAPVRR